MPDITPFLWFDTQAEAAARFYVSLFPQSRIIRIIERTASVPVDAGEVLTVAFELDRKPFVALNGGPFHKFTEAVSFAIHCATQDEIDRYWHGLGAGGTPGQCGWLKDRFGLAWQVVPDTLPALLSGPAADRVMAALLTMTKLDIAVLQAAAS